MKIPGNRSSDGLPGWMPGFFLVAIVLLAYQPVWHCGFVWGDDLMVTDNPLVLSPGGFFKIWCNRSAEDFVPAAITTFWLEWRIWGSHALAYHLDNVLLHAGSALLLWRILRRLKIPGAWLAAALFALNPVDVESVAWISQRKTTLAMLCMLAATECYLIFEDSGKRLQYWMAAGLFLLGLMSKTAIVPLAVLLPCLAWWRRGRIDRRDVKRSLVFLALAAGGSLLAIWIQHASTGGVPVRTDGLMSRLAGAGWALWFYFYKALLPVNLCLVYPQWKINTGNPISWLPLAVWIVGMVILWRHRNGWSKGALAALGYFFIMLLPVLGLANIYFMRFSPVTDHWQYFAIIGPMALAAGVIRKPALGAILLVILGVLTWKQCQMYVNMNSFWQTTYDRNPGSALACLNVGVNQMEKKNVDGAITYYRQALALKPDFAEAHDDLGAAFAHQGKMDEALAEYREAIKDWPTYTDAQNNLSNAEEQKRRISDIILRFTHTLQLQPSNATNLNQLAWILATAPMASLRDAPRAVTLARQANELTGGQNPVFLETEAAALAESGQFEEAQHTIHTAIDVAQKNGRLELVGHLNEQLKNYAAGIPPR